MRKVPLLQGGTIGLRRLRPADGPELAAAIQELSLRSRYLRFHTPRAPVDPGEIAYLTDVDQRDRAAWVLFEDGKGIAIGRYARLAGRPEAEVALTVLDPWQGRGLSKLLLAALMRTARAAGIERLVGFMLDENEAVQRLVASLGGQRHPAGRGLSRVELPTDPAALPQGPAADAIRHYDRLLAA